jgi:hypothetical protein
MRSLLLGIGVLAGGALLMAAPQARTNAAAGQQLLASSASATATTLLAPGAAEWKNATVQHLALNRTPPLFDTDEPAAPEIPTVDVRLLRAGGKLLVQMTWHDPSKDSAVLEPVPADKPEARFHKVPSEAGDRFFDAAAVMVPATPGAKASAPSLQMGDAGDPVDIYYWNATRGAMLMQAVGRGTTKRTGQTFPTQAQYESSQWSVTLELPDLPPGTPLAFAVWNGSQKDRDGRKYFSVWQILK